MKTKAIIIILVISILCGVNQAQAATVWDINEDTDIYSGFYGFINIYDTPPDHTTVNMYDGGSDYITTYDESTLNFYDGSADVEALETSNINVLGGSIGILRASNNSVISFSSEAYSESIRLQHFSTCDIIGGTTDNIVATDSSIFNWKGGGITNYISAYDSSIVNIYGYDLFKSPSGGAYGYGYVSGFLSFGTDFFVDLYNIDAYSHITLIPEPATIFFLILGGILIRKRT